MSLRLKRFSLWNAPILSELYTYFIIPFRFFFFFFFLFLFYFVVSPGSGNQFACSELVSVHFISMYAHDLHDITTFHRLVFCFNPLSSRQIWAAIF